MIGSGSQGNIIQGNLIGTDAQGTRALPNAHDGVIISSPNNTVGGTASGDGNVISGNGGHGLTISDTSSNVVMGNEIGVLARSSAAIGNVLDGIFLSNASANSISGNVISGNGVGQDAAGINITGSDSTGNVLSNNRRRSRGLSDTAVPNSLHGIFLDGGASNNTVGPGNIVSGNGLAGTQGVGVYVFGSTTTGNLIMGNRIGTDANGAFALANSAIGVLLYRSPGNTVQGNLISGNRFIGVEIAAATASGNQVIGNMIGTNAAGTAAVPNGFDGVFINNAANNTIGGTATGAGNLISGNTSAGIQLFGPQSTGNVIQGNALGLDIAGRPTLPNLRGGIFVNTTPGLNQIGGNTPGQANYGQSRIVYGIGGTAGSPSAGTSSVRRAVRGRNRESRPVTSCFPPCSSTDHRRRQGDVRPGLAPKGTLSIRANSPLKGAGPVTEQM